MLCPSKQWIGSGCTHTGHDASKRFQSQAHFAGLIRASLYCKSLSLLTLFDLRSSGAKNIDLHCLQEPATYNRVIDTSTT
eukprot:2967199-Amphidinium_carterae.1